MNRKRVIGIVLILGILIGIPIGRVLSNDGNPTVDEFLGIFNFPWVNASVGVNAPFYYQNGELLSQVEQESYTIFLEDSITKSKNGLTGKIDYSGSDTSTVIQLAIDSVFAVGGGSVFVRNSGGFYSISSDILMKSNVNMFSDGAELRRTGVLTNSVFDLNGATDIRIEGFFFNGNLAGSGRGIGRDGKNIIIEKNRFDGWNTQHSVGVYDSENIKLLNNFVGDCSGFGSAGNVTGMLVKGNYFFEATLDFAIIVAGNLYANDDVIIEDNIIPYGSTEAGGCIDVVARNVIIKNNIVKNGYLNNIFIHDNIGTGGTDEIQKAIIEDNIIFSPQTGRGLVITNNDTTTNANIQVKNNYIENGMTLGYIGIAKVSENDVNGGGIYLLEGRKHDYYNNYIYNGTYCFNIEPSVTFIDDCIMIGNRLEASTAIFYGSRLPTNHIYAHNLGYP